MFMVLPMIFLGLYNLKENNYLKFYVFFILGYMIGMNSHLVSMFFYTMFVGIFILYYHKVFFDKKRFKALLISSLIVVGLTLPFLITILEHKFLGIYRVFTDSFANLYDLQVLCLNFSSLFKAISTFSGVMCYFNIGLICLFVLTTFSLFSRKNDVNNEVKIIFLLLIIILIILVCSKSIWKYVPKLFLSIQFPWRLLVLLSLLVSLYSPMILVDIKINKYIKNILVIILIVLCVFDGINNIKYYDNEEINVDEALVSDLSLGYQNEYSPYVKCGLGRIILSSKWCYPIKDYKIDSNNDSMIEIIDDKFPNMEFVVSDLTEDTIIEFPRTFYLGYELLSEDGDEFQLYNNEFGFLTSSINKNGVYKLNYVKTKFHRIAEFIRLLTCLLILIFLLVRVIKFLINNER